MLLAKLGNKIINTKRKKTIEELIKIESENHTRTTYDEAIRYLVKKTNELYNIQKQHNKHHHDQTYFVLSDIHNIFEHTDDYECYLSLSVRISFENNYEEYEVRGDRAKNLSIKEYLLKIYDPIKNLLDEKKNLTKKEQKVQLIIAVTSRHISDVKNKYIIYIKSREIPL